ncbi:hypothetical protein HMPREF1548_03797 [Clostridium sp. KLE 1755]|nr:hypothetical protein HMPREF1548_03797 [Clostridium sp. KLE 1755]
MFQILIHVIMLIIYFSFLTCQTKNGRMKSKADNNIMRKGG